MNRLPRARGMTRLCACRVGFVVGCLLACVSAAAVEISAAAVEPPHTTVQVGVWTLRQTREVTVTPLGNNATVQRCASCPSTRLTEATVRAGRAGLVWTAAQSLVPVQTLRFDGGVRLHARDQSLVLLDPVRMQSVKGALEIVATVPLERYVEMVVAAESGAADSAESRKALAVVARSFALDRRQRHAGFDVCDSTHCQWVRWRSTPEAHQATLATAGESLWWRGARLSAVFHQNCGGRTAAAGEIWPPSPSQQGMLSRGDPFCQRVGSADWSAQISLHDLAAALATAGLARPGWKTLRVVARSASGRAATLDADGVRMGAEDFRLAVGRTLGWNLIRSNWFEIAPAGTGFVFHGRGTGHGVGLCQTGAAEMAREGKNEREILEQYFPGALLGDVNTGHAWQSIAAPGVSLATTEPADAQYVTELSRALATAESRSGLQAHGLLTVRTYSSIPAFRNATLAPGWVAAFTEGDQIAVQPLRVLAGRRLLARVALHEFLHALVEEQTTGAAPLWLREGVVEVWAGEADAVASPRLTPEQTSAALVHAGSRAESEAAHRAAAWYAALLLHRAGRERVLEGLRRGLPPSLVDTLR